MINKKISIIVPVFNVEKYLERCVNSLVNQTYQNIEIILVDDCSSDSSPEICDTLAESDNRIRVFHKEKNEGLGFARNTGIENAVGDYIIFVDSDDYVDLKTCETALQKLEEYEADICCYLWADVYKNSIEYKRLIDETLVFEGNQISENFLTNCLAPDENENSNEFGISSCMAMYKTALLKENCVFFVSEREYMNEDMLFRIELCKHINKAIIIPDNLYYYFHNSGTLTTKYNEQRFEKSVKMFKKVNELCSCFNCSELVKRNSRYFMINTLVSIKQEVEYKGISSVKTIKKICLNNEIQDVLEAYPIASLPMAQRLFFELIKRKNAFAIFVLTKIKLASDKKSLS